MIANLKESKLAAHIVDGPRGPSGKVKAGVIRLAHATDAVIVPKLGISTAGISFFYQNPIPRYYFISGK
jgi:lysophospholipid acyltransferase (LPLAT)-like uncharacterized protein